MSPRRRQALAVGSILAALTALAYARPLFLGDTFILRDHLIMAVPARDQLARAFHAGRLPEWWSEIGLGVAYAANPAHAVFYPVTWLAAILPASLASDLILILHVFFAGAGAALLARRWGADTTGAIVAGGALMLSGYMASVLPCGIPAMALAWFPWIAWAVDRLAAAASAAERARGACVVAAMLAALILVGDPAALITCGLLAGVVTLARAPRRPLALAALAAAVLGAVLLAAVTVLPALHLLGESQRAGGIPLARSGAWSLHPIRVLEWVWPGLLGDPAAIASRLAHVVADSGRGVGLGPSWAASEHVGAAVLFFAALAGLRRQPAPGARALLLGSLAFVLLALGTYTPLYGLYRAVVPLERFVRYPEKHVTGALVIWCVLAGVGFTRAFGEAPSRRVVLGAGAAAAALVGLVGAAALARGPLGRVLAARAEALGLVDLDVPSALGEALAAGALAAGVAAAIALLLGLRGRPAFARLAGGVAAGALLAHLLAQSWSATPLASRAAFARPPAILAPILEGPRGPADPPPRVYRPQAVPSALYTPAAYVESLVGTAFQNIGTLWGIAYYPGYDSSHARRFWDFLLLAGERAPAERILSLLDVRWAILPGGDASATGLPIRARGARGWALVEWSRRRPRAFVAPRWRVVASDEEAHASLFAPEVDLAQVRLAAPRGPAAEIGEGTGPGELTPCAVRSPRPERVELECDSPAGGYAVLLDAWAPGWSATVDGAPARIERADVLVRAVRVEPGRHRIVLRYRTPGLGTGAAVSAGAWLAWAAILVAARRRRTPAPAPAG